MLPDDVLLVIFDLYRKNQDQVFPPLVVWKWHVLVHVCRRWRQITFSSPRYLDLRILCTYGSPVRKDLGIWPALPIVVKYGASQGGITPYDEDNLNAALEHPDRVSHVDLFITGSQLGDVAMAMQEPFPVLTHLSIFTPNIIVPVISSGFLGGSAPCLQEVELTGVPFPTVPALLLSASDLARLRLCLIPSAGYISPEAMVATLAALPRLTFLQLDFECDTPQPDQMHLPPATQTVFPSLAHFYFSGICEYMEDFMARIDAPRLGQLEISYPIQFPGFEVPQLSEFINRSEYLKKQTLSRRCELKLYHGTIEFHIAHATSYNPLAIYCEALYWEISQITHVLGWISPILSDMVHFAIIFMPFKSEAHTIDDIEWLQLLHLFSSLQTLFVSRDIAGDVSRALEDITGAMVTEVLPALDLLCLQDQPVSSVDKFIAIRRDSGHPVTVINTQEEFDDRLESYP